MLLLYFLIFSNLQYSKSSCNSEMPMNCSPIFLLIKEICLARSCWYVLQIASGEIHIGIQIYKRRILSSEFFFKKHRLLVLPGGRRRIRKLKELLRLLLNIHFKKLEMFFGKKLARRLLLPCLRMIEGIQRL